MKRPVRCAALLLLLLVAAACGQKSGVSDTAAAPAPGGQTAVDAGTPTDPAAGGATDPGALGDGSGAPVAGTPAAPSSPAPSAGTRPPGGSAAPASPARPGQAATGGGSTATTRAGSQAPAPGSPPPSGSAPAPGPAPAPNVDRTGVTDTSIKIGVHAPVTGAAPFPQNTFDKGKDVYWNFIKSKGGIFGRNVEVIFRDDQFNPSRAVQVCRELVEQQKVFLLIGAAGSEQITACARYANASGVPFLSGGVNEDGLTGLNTYFAVSMTYAQQSPLLTQLVANRLKKTKIAIVINNTPALNEAQQSITTSAQQAGLTIVRNSRIGKNASDSELLAEAAALRQSGAEVVYLLTSPVNFIKLATNAQAQAYNPIYIGPGVTNGINIVAEAGCPQIGAAKFLSPFPQLDVIDRLDPDYQKAYRAQHGSDGDDIGLAQWGISKTLHRMFEATGKDLSRQSFLATLVSGREFVSNVFPIVSYTGSVRFGAKSMHLLEADCSARRYKTIATFATGF